MLLNYLPFPRYNSNKNQETFGGGFGSSVSPVDATTYYWYGNPAAAVTVDTGLGIKVDYDFQIIAVKVWIRCAVAGTTEIGSFEIGLNRAGYATTGLSLQWNQSIQSYVTSNYTRNGNSGDIITARIVCPTWVTNPTTVFMWAEITIKRR